MRDIGEIFTERMGSIGRFLELNVISNISSVSLKAATGRPCVLASAHSGTVPAITSDCFSVAESLMRRRYFDLCVTASSRTMLTFENNVSCSSRDCSTIAFCRR